jgi:CheY-like chemotaxis protein
MTFARVMSVDDETPFVEVLSNRLSKRDLLVMTAGSGPEALDKLKDLNKLGPHSQQAFTFQG